MRNSNVILLDEDRVVTIKELRVKDVRQLLSGFTDLDKLDMSVLLGKRFGEISKLIEPFVDFPKGESIDDLTGSELQQVIDGIKSVNNSFLILAGLEPAAPSPSPEPMKSTEPALDY